MLLNNHISLPKYLWVFLLFFTLVSFFCVSNKISVSKVLADTTSSNQNLPKNEVYLEGLKYFYGRGIEENKNKAFELYKEAAEAGHAKAQNNLGLSYEMGYGVKKDISQAIYWYRKSAEQGNATAQNNLGNKLIHAKATASEGFQWYKKSAEQGNADAQFNLAASYHKGFGTQKNLDKAIEFYKQAVNQDHIKAAFNLGVLYYQNGNYEESLKYHTIAANAQNPDSINYLANLYLKGQGVDQNFFRSAELFKAAANLGSASANLYIEARKEKCSSDNTDRETKFYSCIIAAEAGNAPAQHAVATYYHYGQNLEKDPEKALFWSTKAAVQGYAPSQIGMIYYYENEALDVDKEKAIAYMTTEKLLENIKQKNTPEYQKLLQLKDDLNGAHFLENQFRSYLWAKALDLNPEKDELSEAWQDNSQRIIDNIFSLREKLEAISPDIKNKYQELDDCSAKLYEEQEQFLDCYQLKTKGAKHD